MIPTSGFSPQALAYYEGGAIEGVLLIDEAEGLQRAEYIVRQAMSEGRVGRLTVGKDDSGGWGGKQLVARVSASIITTTTSPALHPENQTRVFDLWIDDSQEQTRQVLAALADRAAGGAAPDGVEAELALWRTALARLEVREVKIPYARELAARFPTGDVRMRRDFGRVLSLIKVSTLLHQCQRLRFPDGAVVADLDDCGVAYRLLQHILEPTMQGLTSKAVELCLLHDELAALTPDGWVRRADLEAEAARRKVATSNTVHGWCRQLAKLGYWAGETRGPHGAWYHKKIRDPGEEPVLLPRPEELEQYNLPVGPNSLVGRSRDCSDRRPDDGPNDSRSSEASHQSSNAVSEAAHSVEEHWEESEIWRRKPKKSSHTADWEVLGPRDRASSCRIAVPNAWVDGDWR